MLTPIFGQDLPSHGSHKIIYFDCSCGNKNIQVRWDYFSSGQTKTCTKCNIKNKTYWENTKFGKLRMKDPIEIHQFSHKITTWLCDCGKETNIDIYLVTGGNTNSCGKCNLLTVEHWRNTKYGKLRMKEPVEILKGSNQKVTWLCDCGKEADIIVYNVTRNLQKTCGKCNLKDKSYWENTKFGKLKMKEPVEIHYGSSKKVAWLCDCGKETVFTISDVTRLEKNINSCGMCSILPAEFFKTAKYGKLKLKNPIDLYPASHQKTEWLCDCGNEAKILVHNVVRGLQKSCGKCYAKAKGNYEFFKEEIRKLKPPISPDQISNFMEILEPIIHTEKPIRAVCPACKNEYKPIWGNIRNGKAITCGCASTSSGAQVEIINFIKSIGLEVLDEHKVNNLKYDIFIPSSNLLIEYNGLKWHSLDGSKLRDFNKYKNAISNGYSYVMIFEDEWLDNRLKIENLLRNKLKLKNSTSLRPSKCSVSKINSQVADEFYGIFHYIGPCKSKINYGVFYQEKLIACTSFKIPTRQSKHKWELVRMASNPEFRVHGIWSKILKMFVEEHNSKSIVSFSDNRLFQGEVYSKIGFKFDGEIPPDYYWVKGQKRFHKSGLRKKSTEDLTKTENELRQAQGYSKIWDLGKKRWVYV
jgi:hypothetical protein